MLFSIGKLLPLALSTGVLICLTVLFVGCTSSSSQTDLYFMKVSFSDFPKLESLDARRSIGMAGIDASSVVEQATSVANSVTLASAAAHSGISQASNDIMNLAHSLEHKLPAFYSVGLFGYCQGPNDGTSYSNCSTPNTSFSFNLLQVFSSLSPGIDELLPSSENRLVSGYRDISKWIISAYITGFIATVLTIVFTISVMRYSWGKPLLIISSLVAAVLVVGASVGATVNYGIMTGAIKAVLGSLGVQANIGARTMTATWFAVAFSVGASLILLIEMFCCCL